MSQVGFETAWLNERFKYDNAARNKSVEQSFLDHFGGEKEIKIVDIGSGTGANCLYFLEKLTQNQKWFLVEKDVRFFDPTIERLTSHASKNGYEIEVKGAHLKIQTPSKTIEIHIINDSFFNLPKLLNLQEINAVMAAAVFDLLSEKQFRDFVSTVFENKTALLATMNYSGMHFLPSTSLDNHFVNIYENHMMRQQDFGKGMGKNVASVLSNHFSTSGYDFISGESNWELDYFANKMHAFLLDFMDDSISELLTENNEKLKFKDWLSKKRSLSENKKLSIEVRHFDFFVKPA